MPEEDQRPDAPPIWGPGEANEPRPMAPAPRVRRPPTAPPERGPRDLGEVVAGLAAQLTETNSTLLRLSREVTQIGGWVQSVIRDRQEADIALGERIDALAARCELVAGRVDERGDAVVARIDERGDAVVARIDERFDAVAARVEDKVEETTAHVLRQGESLRLGIDAIVPALNAAVDEQILPRGEAHLADLLSVVSHELTELYERTEAERAAMTGNLTSIQGDVSSLATVVSRLGRAFRALDARLGEADSTASSPGRAETSKPAAGPKTAPGAHPRRSRPAKP